LEQFQNPLKQIIERGKSDNHNTKIHDRSCSWLDAGTSIKRGGVKLDFVPKETLYDLLLM
jgi:hypothetical protein